MDFTKLQLAEPVVSSRGAKSCALSNDNAKFILTVGSRESPLTSPFGASSFSDETTSRKTIEYRLPPTWVDYFDSFDSWAVTYLTCNSERLFGKPLTIEQVRDSYKPCVTRRGNYQPTLRCKLNIAGTSAVRCWTPLEQRMGVPEDFRGYEMVPRVSALHLWCMNREFGFVFQVNDLMCSEVSQCCPF
jgi:hypothetical protein